MRKEAVHSGTQQLSLCSSMEREQLGTSSKDQAAPPSAAQGTEPAPRTC